MESDHPGLFVFNNQRATKREGNDYRSSGLHSPAGAVLQRFRQVRQMPSGALLIRSFSACR